MKAILALALLPVMVCAAAAETDPAILYSIARGAQIQAEIQMGSSVPDTVRELVARGAAEVEAIAAADDPESATEHFLAAMELFNRAFRLMDANGGETEDAQIRYAADLERLLRYYNQLRHLAAIYGVAADYGELESLFETAREQVEDEDEGVGHTLQRISQAMGDLREEIGLAAAEEDKAWAVRYAAQYVEYLDRLVSGAEALNIPPGVVEEVRQVRDKLEAATDPAEIISLIEEVLEIKKDLDLDRSDRLEVWVMQVENTIMRLWDSGAMDRIEYNAVTMSLDKCKGMLAAGEFSEAEAFLGQINDWLIVLEWSS